MKTKKYDAHEALVKEVFESYESLKKYNLHSKLILNYNREIKGDILKRYLQKTHVAYEITTDTDDTVVAVEVINR